MQQPQFALYYMRRCSSAAAPLVVAVLVLVAVSIWYARAGDDRRVDDSVRGRWLMAGESLDVLHNHGDDKTHDPKVTGLGQAVTSSSTVGTLLPVATHLAASPAAKSVMPPPVVVSPPPPAVMPPPVGPPPSSLPRLAAVEPVSLLPAGSYSGSCQNCTLSSTTSQLRCSCQDGYGGWVLASMDDVAQCMGVENDHGRLQCGQLDAEGHITMEGRHIHVSGADGTFSQNYQDTWVMRLAASNGWIQQQGFFLDLGAFSGEFCSNSRLLEDILGHKANFFRV